MKCPNCGAEIHEGQKFCTKCGYSLIGITDNSIKEEKVDTQPIVEKKVVNTSPKQETDEIRTNIRSNNIEGFLKANKLVLLTVAIITVIVIMIMPSKWYWAPIIGALYLAYEYFYKNNGSQTQADKTISSFISNAKNSDAVGNEKDYNKNVLLAGIVAGALQLLAIVKLPFIQISEVLSAFQISIPDLVSEMGNLPNLSSKITNIFNDGNITLLGFSKMLKQIKPLVKLSMINDVSESSDMNSILTGINVISFVIMLMVILSALVIVVALLKKYVHITFFIAGLLPLAFDAILYVSLKEGASAENVDVSTMISLIAGKGLYLGVITAIVLVVLGMYGFVKTKKL